MISPSLRTCDRRKKCVESFVFSCNCHTPSTDCCRITVAFALLCKCLADVVLCEYTFASLYLLKFVLSHHSWLTLSHHSWLTLSLTFSFWQLCPCAMVGWWLVRCCSLLFHKEPKMTTMSVYYDQQAELRNCLLPSNLVSFYG